MKILITGASGFIGSFLVEHGLASGHEVWAGIRATSNLRYLDDCRIRPIRLDFSNEESLCALLQQQKAESGAWDIIVHAAGATKCRNKADFFRTNTAGTEHFVHALQRTGMVPRQFIYISSLSVYGPVRERRVATHPCAAWNPRDKECGAPLTASVYDCIHNDDTPQPDTAYGESKLAAERFIMAQQDFPYVILRPTGVYGPRERDYFLMAKSITGHVDFAPGLKPQELTFVYVKDLVQAVYRIIDKGITQKSYFVSDGQTYHSRAFSELLQRELGIRRVLRLKAPLLLLRTICLLAELAGRLTGKATTLNTDKYNIMKQRNWQCDITPLVNDSGYKPEYDLSRGVAEAVAWYKNEKWL